MPSSCKLAMCISVGPPCLDLAPSLNVIQILNSGVASRNHRREVSKIMILIEVLNTQNLTILVAR